MEGLRRKTKSATIWSRASRWWSPIGRPSSPAANARSLTGPPKCMWKICSRTDPYTMNPKAIDRYRANLQGEIDSLTLYLAMAEAEPQAPLAELYRRLAKVEVKQ